MKRPGRTHLACAASLTALAIVAAVWIRSHWRIDALSQVDSQGATRALVSRAGALHVVDSQTRAALDGFDFGSYDLPAGPRLPVLHNVHHLRWRRIGFALVHGDKQPIMMRPSAGVQVPYDIPPNTRGLQRPNQASRPGGIIIARPPMPPPQDVLPWLHGLPYFELVVPYWSLALLALLYPLWRGGRAVRSFRRRRRGLCRDCGYDLRATADRCPECGAAAPAPRGAPAPAAPG